LKLLKRYNPRIPIYGLYGGALKSFPIFRQKLSGHLKDIYCIKGHTSMWKWKNSDLAVRAWYKDIGHSIDFDVVYIIEWDLLILESLKKIYPDAQDGTIILTGLTPLKNVSDGWDWVTTEPFKSQWHKLLRLVKNKYDYNQEPYASLGPGACLCKSFLEQYSKDVVPDLAHDELRLPLYAQLYNMKLKDTGFYRYWFNINNEKKFFNCNSMPIRDSVISAEMRKPNGRRIFHPYRKTFRDEHLPNR